MKSGKCPKCNQRNVSKCRSSKTPAIADVATLAPAPSKEHAYLDLRERINKANKALLDAQRTVIYACSDCHYSETYLSDTDFPKPLGSYDGWERVSAPASGPFR